MKYYPKVCRQEVSIHVIQSGEHILNTVSRIVGSSHSRTLKPVFQYSEAISKYAEVGHVLTFLLIWINTLQDKFAREGVDLITRARLAISYWVVSFDGLMHTQCLIRAFGLRCLQQEG